MMANSDIVTLDRLCAACHEVGVGIEQDYGYGPEPYLESNYRKLVHDFIVKWPWINQTSYGQPDQVTFADPWYDHEERSIQVVYGPQHPTVAEFVEWFDYDNYWSGRGCDDGRYRFKVALGWDEDDEDEEPVEWPVKRAHVRLETCIIGHGMETWEHGEQLDSTEHLQAFLSLSQGMVQDTNHARIIRWIPGESFSEIVVEISDAYQFVHDIVQPMLVPEPEQVPFLSMAGFMFRIRRVTGPFSE